MFYILRQWWSKGSESPTSSPRTSTPHPWDREMHIPRPNLKPAEAEVLGGGEETTLLIKKDLISHFVIQTRAEWFMSCIKGNKLHLFLFS